MREVMHVRTGAGRVAVRISSGNRTPLLLVHGNSMSARAFDGLLDGPLGRSYRLIAADLPGHGASENAIAPEKTYTLPGYAEAMLDVLFALDASNAAVCGWSLGGHIALEMMAHSPHIAGAFVVSAPPVAPGAGALAGFNVSDALALYMTEHLDEAAQRMLADISAGAAAPLFAYESVARTDGRARPIVVQSILAGVGSDPQTLFDDAERPVALILGEFEQGVSKDFMQSIHGPALWRNAIQTIAGAGHAPFLDQPVEFNKVLLEFMRDLAKQGRGSNATPVTKPLSRKLA